MGSGVSKKGGTRQANEISEDEVEYLRPQGVSETPQKPTAPQRTSTAATVTQPRAKIVGLLDSSDDEDKDQGGYLAAKKKPLFRNLSRLRDPIADNDALLKEELRDLESTFQSLEEDDKRWRKLPYDKSRSAFPARHPDLPTVEAVNFSRSASPTLQRPPKTSRHRSLAQPPTVPLRPTGRNLRFSWEDQSQFPQEKDTDDWTYKQTVIRGFDPEKFRQVNTKTQHNLFDADIRIERSPLNISSSTHHHLHHRHLPAEIPGVPTYDISEKQLLASLEQELGVL